MRGLEKVRAEFSLSTLAYDIKALNIVGTRGCWRAGLAAHRHVLSADCRP